MTIDKILVDNAFEPQQTSAPILRTLSKRLQLHSQKLLPHLFRTEYSKIVAVLCHSFDVTHLEIAEDIASETFLKATELWGIKGVPENPAAWLYTVAKNKTRDYFKHNTVFEKQVKKAVQLKDKQTH